MTLTHKECHVCHRLLPLEQFARHVGRKDGLQANCRECNHRIYMKKNVNRVKWLSHFPDEELVEELKARGALCLTETRRMTCRTDGDVEAQPNDKYT